MRSGLCAEPGPWKGVQVTESPPRPRPEGAAELRGEAVSCIETHLGDLLRALEDAEEQLQEMSRDASGCRFRTIPQLHALKNECRVLRAGAVSTRDSLGAVESRRGPRGGRGGAVSQHRDAIGPMECPLGLDLTSIALFRSSS